MSGSGISVGPSLNPHGPQSQLKQNSCDTVTLRIKKITMQKGLRVDDYVAHKLIK